MRDQYGSGIAADSLALLTANALLRRVSLIADTPLWPNDLRERCGPAATEQQTQAELNG